MILAVYGKHPAKGDFLEHGIPPGLKPLLEGWLDATLAQAREALGADWQAVWPAAPMLRFWLGEGIWGAPLAGVIAPSQDRVGRRFPLVLLALGARGAGLPPPVIDPDQSWYDAACAHLATVLARDDLGGPADLLAGAPAAVAIDPAPGPAAFWAVRPGVDVAGLLADIALTDHRRTSEGRSYWWVAGLPEPDTAPELPQAVAPDPVENGGDVAQETEAAQPGETTPAESDPWDLADVPDPEDSPFSAATGAISLFAPPEPGFVEVAEIAPATFTPPAPRVLWSQVWAGPGLPSGDVLAWFFRGHAVND